MTAAASARPARRGRAVAALVVVALAVTAIVAGLLLQAPPQPAPPPVAAPPRAPLIVTVSHAGDPVANVGFPTPISVHALGNEPIVAVELWVGARLVGQAENAGGGPAQVARWSWTPAQAGPATLVARVTDARGREAQSAPLRLHVRPDAPLYRPVRQVVAEAGETAAAAAARVGGEAADLARWNNGLDPQAPLEDGSVIFVPLPVAQVPRPDTRGEVQLIAGLGPGPTLDLAAGAGTASLASWSGAGPDVTIGPPAAGTGLFVPPEVVPTVDGCSIELAVSDEPGTATGLALYGLGPGSTTFARVATFPTGGDAPSTWRGTASAGTYLFSASAYDGSVEQQGDLVEVTVPADCTTPGWSGDATLVGGRLRSAVEVDRAYLYLSLNQGPYQRVPADPGTFVERLDGELDFSPYLPPDLASAEVDLEAWGWKGNGLLPMGSGHQEPGVASPAPGSGSAAPGTPPPNPVGGGGIASEVTGVTFTHLDWIATKLVASTETEAKEVLLREGELAVWTSTGAVKADLTEDFRWLTTATGVDSVVWQVAAFPMPSDLAPEVPGVLLQKVVSVAEGTQTGEFPIDFRPIFVPPTKSAQIGDVTNGGLVQQITMAQLGEIASTPPSPLPGTTGAPGPTASPPAGGSASAGGGSAVYSPTWMLPTFTPSVLYVRAIPMDGATVAADVSNFVRFAVVGDDAFVFDPSVGPSDPGPKPTPGLKPYQFYLELLPPANANPAFANCVMVTGFQPDIISGAWGLEPGDFICRFESSGGDGWSLADAFGDFVGYVADAWDAVASAWSWIQGQLAAALAKYSGCSAIAGGDFCEGLAQVAISAALASVGIPPSLPNTEALIAMGKGELKDALVGMASDYVYSLTGVDPCAAAELAKEGLGTDSCDDIADQLIDDLLSQLDKLKSDEAAALTGVVVPYGVNVVPHPWGQLRPPRFRVTVARNVNVPLPTTGACRMTLAMGSTVKDWTHPVYNELTKSWGTTTETVSGAPFLALTVDVPDPTAADSGAVKLPVSLPPDASIYQVMLAALNEKLVMQREYWLTEAAFWREPGNPGWIYVPGQGTVSFTDHGSRAWVLLQNGAVVKGTVTRAPYAADCFDTVVAYGAIPLEDQGYPCLPLPDPANMWEATFSGLGGKGLACELMYKAATGY